jgi:hypothetical protein
MEPSRSAGTRTRRGGKRLAVGLGVALALIGASQVAAAPPAGVSGSWTYSVPGGRHVSIQASLFDGSPRGAWHFTNTSSGNSLEGTITCLVIDGDAAWLAGPTDDGDLAQFTFLYDGGVPGAGNDFAVTWITDPGQTLADMEAWCESQNDLGFSFEVESGNVTVR